MEPTAPQFMARERVLEAISRWSSDGPKQSHLEEGRAKLANQPCHRALPSVTLIITLFGNGGLLKPDRPKERPELGREKRLVVGSCCDLKDDEEEDTRSINQIEKNHEKKESRKNDNTNSLVLL